MTIIHRSVHQFHSIWSNMYTINLYENFSTCTQISTASNFKKNKKNRKKETRSSVGNGRPLKCLFPHIVLSKIGSEVIIMHYTHEFSFCEIWNISTVILLSICNAYLYQYVMLTSEMYDVLTPIFNVLYIFYSLKGWYSTCMINIHISCWI